MIVSPISKVVPAGFIIPGPGNIIIVNNERERSANATTPTGERTAEEVKIRIGSAYPLKKRMTMEVKGRDLVAGIPKTLIISDEEVREALTETFVTIVEAVKIALERTPPELAADIVDKGLVVAGGGSLIKGLDALLKEATGLPITLAMDPLSAVALGAGKVLGEPKLLRKVNI